MGAGGDAASPGGADVATDGWESPWEEDAAADAAAGREAAL